MKIWFSHPTGNSVVRALLAGAIRAGFDYRFFSSLAVSTEEGWVATLPAKLRSELSRRAYDIPRERLERRPGREVARLLAEKAMARSFAESHPFSIDSIYRTVDRAMARRLFSENRAPDAVYAFEDGALETFTAACQRQVRRIYDLPIAYWETSRRILSREADRWPKWAPTLGITSDSAEKLARKTAEIEKADVVICPSKFVLDSLPDKIRATRSCVVAPFGAPRVTARRGKPRSKLRVLFAGAMSQRKGLADVFGAARMLKSTEIEWVVMGAPRMPMRFYRDEFAGFTHEPPRSHTAVLELMLTCDLMVLPSLVEGRAVVQHEALACGLPLIVTPNAGAEEMIVPGETGFLVPPGAPEAIADRVAWFLARRGQLEEMRQTCRAKASEYTWEAYFDRVARAISPVPELVS